MKRIFIMLSFLILSVFLVEIIYASPISGSNYNKFTIPDDPNPLELTWIGSPILISTAPCNARATSVNIAGRIIHPYKSHLFVVVPNQKADKSLKLYDGKCEPPQVDDYVFSSTTDFFDGDLVNRTWVLMAADQCLGDSGYIDYWTITITYDLPPNPPSNLYGNPGPKSGEVTLNWTPSSGPDLAGYWLRLDTSSGHYYNSYKITLDEITSDWTGITFSGLTNGTRYYFAVAAYDSRGWDSCLSNEISIVPGGAAGPPTGVIAVPGPGSGQLILKWDGNSDAYIDHYKIYQGTSSGIYDIVYNNIPRDWHDGTIIFDLIDNKTYYFVMTSVNIVGVESVFSNVANATPTDLGDAEPPSNPANLYITDPGTGRNLQLSWYPSSDDMGVSHYLVYRLTNSSNVSEYNYDSGFPQHASGMTCRYRPVGFKHLLLQGAGCGYIREPERVFKSCLEEA